MKRLNLYASTKNEYKTFLISTKTVHTSKVYYSGKTLQNKS